MPGKLLKIYKMNNQEFFNIFNKGIDGSDSNDVENRGKSMLGMNGQR